MIRFLEGKLNHFPEIEFDIDDVLGVGGESLVYRRKFNGAICAFKIAPYDEISNDEKTTVQNLHSNPTISSNPNTPPSVANSVSQSNSASQLSTSGTIQNIQLNTISSNQTSPSNSATSPLSVANTISGPNSSSSLESHFTTSGNGTDRTRNITKRCLIVCFGILTSPLLIATGAIIGLICLLLWVGEKCCGFESNILARIIEFGRKHFTQRQGQTDLENISLVENASQNVSTPPSVANRNSNPAVSQSNSSSQLFSSTSETTIQNIQLNGPTLPNITYPSSPATPPSVANTTTIGENDVNLEFLKIVDETSESIVTLLKHENVIDYSIVTIDIVHGVFAFITGKLSSNIYTRSI